MSQCMEKRIHYMVKDRRSGFACLICGLAGDLDDIKASPCNSQASGSPRPSLRSSHADDAVAMEAAQKALQEEQDHRMALELQELQRQEDELQQLVLLQNLEAEEAELTALLDAQRALNLQAKLDAAGENVLSANDPAVPTPSKSPSSAPSTKPDEGALTSNASLISISPARSPNPVLDALVYGSLADLCKSCMYCSELM